MHVRSVALLREERCVDGGQAIQRRWTLWQPESDSREVPRGDLGAPSVGFSDGANDRQSESGSAPGAGSVTACEALERVLGEDAIEAWARI